MEEKNCIHCGAKLPADAAFCPHCETRQNAIQAVSKPRLRNKRAGLLLIGAAALLACVAVGITCWRLSCTGSAQKSENAENLSEVQKTEPELQTTPEENTPEQTEPEWTWTKSGDAEGYYQDAEGSYRILLSFTSGPAISQQAEASKNLSAGANEEWNLPSQLFILDQEFGKNSQEKFFEQVELCTAEIVPLSDSGSASCTAPVYDEFFSNAARVSHIQFSGNSGTNEIHWTIRMKNGAELSLSQTIYVELLDTVTYTPEDTPMDTIEELTALMEKIEQETEADTVVNIYLPPVTYDGELAVCDRTITFYGGSDGENQTTFTKNVSFTANPKSMQLYGIRFQGAGGVGLLANSYVAVVDCSFVGWETGVQVVDGGWIHLERCYFEENQIGYLLNSSISSGTSENFAGNSFIKNDTAVQIITVPGDLPIDFVECTFSQNQIDIDNQSKSTIESTGSVFEKE